MAKRVTAKNALRIGAVTISSRARLFVMADTPDVPAVWHITVKADTFARLISWVFPAHSTAIGEGKRAVVRKGWH